MKLLVLLEKIPDFLYPIPEKVNGVYVISKRAYDARLRVCEERWGHDGAQRHCTRLIFWRALCHVAGSVMFLLALHYYVMPLGVIVAVLVSIAFAAYFAWQEFIYQRTAEHLLQTRFKAMLDFWTWVAPVLGYWLTFWALCLLGKCQKEHDADATNEPHDMKCSSCERI